MMEVMDFINQNWGIFMALVPLIVAIGSKYTSPARVKLALAVGVTLVLTIISALGMDWASLGTNELIERFLTIFGGAQLLFHSVNEALKASGAEGFNAQMMPERGIG